MQSLRHADFVRQDCRNILTSFVCVWVSRNRIWTLMLAMRFYFKIVQGLYVGKQCLVMLTYKIGLEYINKFCFWSVFAQPIYRFSSLKSSSHSGIRKKRAARKKKVLLSTFIYIQSQDFSIYSFFERQQSTYYSLQYLKLPIICCIIK